MMKQVLPSFCPKRYRRFEDEPVNCERKESCETCIENHVDGNVK